MGKFSNIGPRLGDVRIITLNLWQLDGVWADRRSVLIAGLRELQPDLVAFQESIKNDEYDQVTDLLGPEFNVSHQKVRSSHGFGISIASRWPLGEVLEVDLNVTSRTTGFLCPTLVAEVIAPDPVGPLLFVNHFPSWQLNFEHERELQAVTVARFLEERVGGSNKPVLMAGDLDADPNSAGIRFWSGRQSLGGMSVCYRDAWESRHPEDPGHTFTPLNPLMRGSFRDWPFRRIDYIFVRFEGNGAHALDIAACERIFDEPVNGVWASDHFGLVADLAKC